MNSKINLEEFTKPYINEELNKCGMQKIQNNRIKYYRTYFQKYKKVKVFQLGIGIGIGWTKNYSVGFSKKNDPLSLIYIFILLMYRLRPVSKSTNELSVLVQP